MRGQVKSLESRLAGTGRSLTQGFFRRGAFLDASLGANRRCYQPLSAVPAAAPRNILYGNAFLEAIFACGMPRRPAGLRPLKNADLFYGIDRHPPGAVKSLEGCGADRSARPAHLSAKSENF